MKSRILLCILFLLTGNILIGQTYNQLGSDINGIASDNLGGNVSISSDGNIMAIGSPGHVVNSNEFFTGQVKVFELVNNDWVQKGSSLVGEAANDSYGSGLDISDDGNVLVIGAPNSDGNGGVSSFTGRIYIYEWSGSDWSLLQTLNGTAGENFGTSISVSSDGSFLAAGAPNADGGGSVRGAVRVFERTANTWNQVGNDVNGDQDSEGFGTSVSLVISGTDKVIAIGAPVYSPIADIFTNQSGIVRIYRESAGSWGTTWAGPETIIGTLNSASGGSVDLSDSGSRLAIGAPNGLLAGDPNYVEVYEFNASSTPKWQVLGSRINSNQTNGDFGKSVGISGDGSHLIIGAPTSAGTGKENGYTKLFKFESTAWTELDSIPGAAANDEFGFSVAINADGSQYSVGAQGNDAGGDAAGQVQVYELFVPDVTPPTVTLSSSAGAITNSNPVSITITFSEEVTGFEVADITVANATVGPLNTTDDIVYTADITANQDGEYTLSIAADALTDIAGNGNEASNSLAYTLDTQAPTAQVASLVTNNKRPVLTGTVNDANATIQITISGTSASLLTATNNGTTWELAAGSITNELPDGTYNVVLNVEDPAGNAVALTSEGVLTIDATAPTITVEELLTNNTQPTLSGTVSDALSGVASVEVLIGGNTIAATLDENNNWNAAVSADLAEGAYDVTVTALDEVGNEATLTETNFVTIDLTSPTLTITGLEEGSTVQSPDATTLTFTSSEEVTGFELSDINVTNGNVSNFITTNAPVYTADITPEAEGTITVSIAEKAVEDAVGNGNAVATLSYTYERKYSGGTGTEADPYLIANEKDLREISSSVADYGSYFLQTENIEMSAESFTPIGSGNNQFRGRLQVLGRAIFGKVIGANLRNISVTSLSILNVDGTSNIAGLVVDAESSADRRTIIENCFVTGTIEQNDNFGRATNSYGLVIIAKDTDIINCFTDVTHKGPTVANMAGIIGLASRTNLSNSYSISRFKKTTPPSSLGVQSLITSGLIGGMTEGLINNVHFSGIVDVHPSYEISPITSEISTPTSLSNSFWDKELLGIETSAAGGTGLTTSEMRNQATFLSAGWDYENETANGSDDVWTHKFNYPYLKWQFDRAKPFTVSGKVLDENGNPFTAGVVKSGILFGELVEAEINQDGSFTISLAQPGLHSLYIEPSNKSDYLTTYYGNTNSPFKATGILYNNNGLEIQMIAKSQANQLDGNGKVSGRVVSAANGSGGRIVQGTILDGEGLEGVNVFLVRTSDEEILTQVQTDANGDFEITGIPAGEYQLLLDVVGIDVNLEGSTFTMDEEGSELQISAAVSEDGISFEIEEILGIENEIEVAVYPNPVRDFVNIQIPGKAVARIIDVNGTVLKEESFTDNLKLNISELHSNMYFLEISNAKGKAMKKLVKN